MGRLFVFGDSWAFNYFAEHINPLRPDLSPHSENTIIKLFAESCNYYGHWTDYISKYYNVFNYAEVGCSIDSVIYQFGNLPKYKKGDRIVTIFPNSERFSWIVDNKKIGVNYGNLHSKSPWISNVKNNERDILFNQLYIRRNSWNSLNIRNDEKQFINKISHFFKDYEPILITWDSELSDKIPNVKLFTEDFKDMTIFAESEGEHNDYHLGLEGNYKLFKFISKELKIDIEKIDDMVTFKKSIKNVI